MEIKSEVTDYSGAKLTLSVAMARGKALFDFQLGDTSVAVGVQGTRAAKIAVLLQSSNVPACIDSALYGSVVLTRADSGFMTIRFEGIKKRAIFVMPEEKASAIMEIISNAANCTPPPASEQPVFGLER